MPGEILWSRIKMVRMRDKPNFVSLKFTPKYASEVKTAHLNADRLEIYMDESGGPYHA